MRQITHGATQGLADVERFVERLDTHSLFAADAEIIVTRAPGRLDVMGGIADYSGSLVLQLPIREAAIVALQRSTDRKLRIVSLGAEANGREASFRMPMADLSLAGKPLAYDEAREYFAR